MINQKDQPVFPNHPYNVASWHITNDGRHSWMTDLYVKILKCLKKSHNLDEFKQNLHKQNIILEYSQFKNKIYKNHFVYGFTNSKGKRGFIGGKKLGLDKPAILLALQNGFQIKKY